MVLVKHRQLFLHDKKYCLLIIYLEGKTDWREKEAIFYRYY